MNAETKPRRPRRTPNSVDLHFRALDMRPHASRAALLLKALANPQRLMILCNLVGGELTVGELTERLPLGQSATSQHLAVLREQGIVATRREAQAIHYSLQPGPAAQLIAVLHGIYCGSSQGADRDAAAAPPKPRATRARPPGRR